MPSRRSRQRALEIVDNRQQVAENSLALDTHGFLALLTDALARIFSVGERAQVLVLQLGDFFVFFGQLRPQGFQLAARRFRSSLGLIELTIHTGIPVLRMLVSSYSY